MSTANLSLAAAVASVNSKSPDLNCDFPRPRFSRRPRGAGGVRVPHVPHVPHVPQVPHVLRGFPNKAPGNHIHLRTDTMDIRTDDHIDMAPLRSRLEMRAYQVTITRPSV